jgi:signal transduction histidine kinase
LVKKANAAQYPPAKNLEAFPLMRYNAAVSFRRNIMKNRQRQKDILFSVLVFCSAFAVNMLIQKLFTTQTLVSMIFDQEKLRSENEKERMRGNLLRAISHDLRTPLTSIYGSSSTLISKYDALPKEQHLKLLGEI